MNGSIKNAVANRPTKRGRLSIAGLMMLVAYVALALTGWGLLMLLFSTYLAYPSYYLYRPDCLDAHGRWAIRLGAILFLGIAASWTILAVLAIAGADLAFLVRDHNAPLENLFLMWLAVPILFLGILLAILVSRPRRLAR